MSRVSRDNVRSLFSCRAHRYRTALSARSRSRLRLHGPNPPARPSYPEAAGLRHLAFEVDDLSAAVSELDSKSIKHEPIRTDEYTGKQFVFFSDPDGLPIELYEK